jgi:anti-anti-sigma factor
MPVLFKVDHDPPHAHLCIAGDLDLAARDLLRSQLEDLRDCVDGAVRINLADVTFVDCTCLHVFDQLRLDLVAAGRTLHLTSARPSFHLICSLAGYERLSQMTAPRPLILVHPRQPVKPGPRRVVRR